MPDIFCFLSAWFSMDPAARCYGGTFMLFSERYAVERGMYRLRRGCRGSGPGTRPETSPPSCQISFTTRDDR